MVLPLDQAVITALETSGTAAWKASAYYGDSQTVADVPLDQSGSISFDGSASIQGSGTAYLKNDGTDYSPKQQTDAYASFGQELEIRRVLPHPDGSEDSITLGRFRIAEVPSMQGYFRRFPTQIGKIGWSLQLTLRDRLDILANDDFLTPTSAQAGTSTWAELQRIAPQGLGIAQNVALGDAPVPAGITYTSMPDAVVKLLANINAVPHMRRDGLLTGRQKDRWLTGTTPEFTVNGTVNVDDSMTNNLYNCVVLTNPNNANIVSIRQITDPANPLWVGGPLGRRPYKMSDPLMDTQAKADGAAITALARVSTQQAHTVTFSCLPRPDLELGDFGDVVDEVSGRTYRGEIATMSFSLDPTQLMSGTMTVAQVIEPGA